MKVIGPGPRSYPLGMALREHRRRVDARTAALEVARRLVDAGYTAYFAGGCVRDRLMGEEPKDYDVATDARPEALKELFPRAQLVGESFGVVLVRNRGHQVEVATFRTDGVYSDSRRPDAVTFSDADHDARRRDFTINGLFEEPATGRIIDLVGGRADLEARLVRAIGDPAARIREDRLRMLRAVRFAARLGFSIEPATRAAIAVAAGDLRGVSRERIGQEIRMMLVHPGRAAAAAEIQALGLDEPVFLEPHHDPTLPKLGGLEPGAGFPAVLSAWLLDRHERSGLDLPVRAGSWSEALVLSNTERSAFLRCVKVYLVLTRTWRNLGVAAQKRIAAGPGFDDARAVLRAAAPGAAAEIESRVRELERTGLAPPPLLDGNDLIGLGMVPGPLFKRLLDAVYDAQLEGRVTSRPEALDLAGSVAREAARGPG